MESDAEQNEERPRETGVFLELKLDDESCPHIVLEKAAAQKLFPATFDDGDMDMVCSIPLTILSCSLILSLRNYFLLNYL